MLDLPVPHSQMLERVPMLGPDGEYFSHRLPCRLTASRPWADCSIVGIELAVDEARFESEAAASSIRIVAASFSAEPENWRWPHARRDRYFLGAGKEVWVDLARVREQGRRSFKDMRMAMARVDWDGRTTTPAEVFRVNLIVTRVAERS